MSNWSNLPVVIINLIVERVYYIDQIQVRAVCKNQLPWIIGNRPWKEHSRSAMSLPWKDFMCCSFYLYEPSQKHKAKGIKIWLVASPNKITNIFTFYSPFTGETIQVPELHMLNTNVKRFLHTYRATFSTHPTSSDCVVFVFSSPYQGNKFCAWSSHWFNGYYGNMIKNIVYANRVFYCVFDPLFIYMGAYNLILQEWKTHPCSLLFLRPYYEFSLYLIESLHDGNLLLSYYHYKRHIYKVHLDTEIDTLNNRVLISSSVNNISLPAAEGKLADTIHWFTSNGLTTSSGGKGQSCTQIYDWVDIGDRRGGSCIDMDCDGQAEWSKVWIQPRHAHKFMNVEQRGENCYSDVAFIFFILSSTLLSCLFLKFKLK
ncbi:hypothetical protein ACOSP7_014879 [Xanthoceras sorbifolium]